MEQKSAPILLTDNLFIFPTCSQILFLGNNDHLRKILISSWRDSEGKILVISSRDTLKKAIISGYDQKLFFTHGSLAKIEIDLAENADIEAVFNSLQEVQLVGLERIKLLENFRNENENIWKANYQVVQEDLSIPEDLVAKFIRFLPSLLRRAKITMNDSFPYLAIGDLGNFIDFVVQNSNNFEREFKQKILEELRLEERLKLLLETEKKVRKFQQNIDTKINEKIADQQRAIYLREQLEAIQNQLDKIEGNSSEKDIYLKRLENENFPEQVKKVVREEIKNYERMHVQSSEANMIRSHIDLLMSLPWHQKTEEKNDLAFARQELDNEHFGLEKVKERIIEHLAVIQKTKSSLGNVICFVGPPGVGKTSLAASIAKATGRNFVRISVGGVSDEGELRGHRRTYIGALPGKIIQGMKKAQVINPLFLIDEIDKVGMGRFHGDPLSALLEILDPNQNSNFMDNYVGEIPYDLSKVLFICTANSTELPQPLLDRMEIVYLSSYTETEKLKIAKNHLIPKNLKDHSFNSEEITFTEEAVRELIRSFTKESGVRELNRMLQKVIRKFTVEAIQNDSKHLTVELANIPKYFGKRIYDFTAKQNDFQVGVATGLAYTNFGGDILSIEVGFFPGNGSLVLTGTLGDVMKESAKIALDYIKSNCDYFGIDQEIFAKKDIHVHVPEGATPKDGPSAGIALTTAIISALTNKKVAPTIGMTGEITLRGYVLAIGGLREKAIAAHRSGLTTIVIPNANDKDLEDIPQEVRDNLEIILVKDYSEVWEIIIKRDTKVSPKS